MSRPKCVICGKETTPDYFEFEGEPLCKNHREAVRNFIEQMKSIPRGTCILISGLESFKSESFKIDKQ